VAGYTRFTLNFKHTNCHVQRWKFTR